MPLWRFIGAYVWPDNRPWADEPDDVWIDFARARRIAMPLLVLTGIVAGWLLSEPPLSDQEMRDALVAHGASQAPDWCAPRARACGLVRSRSDPPPTRE